MLRKQYLSDMLGKYKLNSSHHDVTSIKHYVSKSTNSINCAISYMQHHMINCPSLVYEAGWSKKFHLLKVNIKGKYSPTCL